MNDSVVARRKSLETKFIIFPVTVIRLPVGAWPFPTIFGETAICLPELMGQVEDGHPFTAQVGLPGRE